MFLVDIFRMRGYRQSKKLMYSTDIPFMNRTQKTKNKKQNKQNFVLNADRFLMRFLRIALCACALPLFVSPAI